MQLQSLIGTQVSRLSESIRNQQIFFVLSFFLIFGFMPAFSVQQALLNHSLDSTKTKFQQTSY